VSDRTELERKVTNEYNPREVFKHVEHICKLGERWSGTPAEDKEVDYIKEVCEKYGVPIELFTADVFISYPVREPPRTPDKEPTLELLGPHKMIKCTTYAFGGSTPPAGIEGELVYVGLGHRKDYDSVNAAGKIALIDLGEMFRGEKVTFAEKNGVIGQIHVQYVPGELQTGNAAQLFGGPADSEDYAKLPRSPIVCISKEDGEYIKQLMKQGSVRVRMKVECWRGWKKVRIPVATVRGTEDPERHVLVYGHIDTWHEGATDNASGNAFMLEMARVLAKHRNKLKRSVKLAWWPCHSTGMYSASTWYAENFWEDVRDNMIAYFTSDSPGTKGGVVYTSTAFPELRNFHVGAVREVIGKDPTVVSFRQKTGDVSFLNAGVPLVSDSLRQAPEVMSKLPYGATPWWHTEKDTIDKVDLEGSGKIQFDTYLTSIIRLCNSDVLPFEFVTVADDMLKALEKLSDGAKGVFDLKRLAERTCEFKASAERLQTACSRSGLNAEERRIINKVLIGVSRILNPVLYTVNDRYAQDPYHTLMLKEISMFPHLHAAMGLHALPEDSDEFHSLKKKLTRERNRVLDAIDEAIDIIETTLARL